IHYQFARRQSNGAGDSEVDCVAIVSLRDRLTQRTSAAVVGVSDGDRRCVSVKCDKTQCHYGCKQDPAGLKIKHALRDKCFCLCIHGCLLFRFFRVVTSGPVHCYLAPSPMCFSGVKRKSWLKSANFFQFRGSFVRLYHSGKAVWRSECLMEEGMPS